MFPDPRPQMARLFQCTTVHVYSIAIDIASGPGRFEFELLKYNIEFEIMMLRWQAANRKRTFNN